MKQAMTVIGLEYAYSKFVRGDNSPEYAKYLGYLDAMDLYPKFVPRSFEDLQRSSWMEMQHSHSADLV